MRNDFALLIKFGSEKNIKSLRNGELYMNRLQYYVDSERNTSNENVGDKYDGQMLLKNVNVTMREYNTQDYVGSFFSPDVSISLDFLNNPVFCVFMFDHRNFSHSNEEHSVTKKVYSFTEVQRKKLSGFGEYALVIKNNSEFFRRVKQGFALENIGFTRDQVSYYEDNNLNQVKEVQNNNLRIAFWKRIKYAYQQEYRFIAHTEVNDNLVINIGDISDIADIVATKKLLNSELTFDEMIR